MPRGHRVGGKRNGKATTGHGPYLARVLGEGAVGAGRTNTFPGERYGAWPNAGAPRRPSSAVGHSILIIIWHLLSEGIVKSCGPPSRG